MNEVVGVLGVCGWIEGFVCFGAFGRCGLGGCFGDFDACPFADYWTAGRGWWVGVGGFRWLGGCETTVCEVSDAHVDADNVVVVFRYAFCVAMAVIAIGEVVP